ncbi:MAG: AAA family ATPase [Alphaproteobacteria bacterium]
MAPDTHQDDVIAFLARPETHGGGGAVVRIDTHISTVFLVGDRAYKLKRAIKFPYLDFSTAEQRRTACEREVVVNRRTAPKIYLGVVPVVRRADGALSLGGAGEAVDYVVEMRRFDDTMLLSRLAERGELSADIAEAAAEAVAVFHRIAEPTPDFGGAAGLRATIEGNGASFAALSPGILDADRIAAIQRACLDRVGRLDALLDRRRQAGLVRHCHGDLHLANICLIDGKPTLFDAIEFSDALANIDILYDFAFFLMDMAMRGLPRQSNAAFNRYLEIDEDFEGLAALPLFLATRAAIRAHVAAAAAERDGAATSRVQARDYLAFGLALLEARPPVMMAVGGLSGTGKSTVARALAPRVGASPGAVILRSDVLRKRLAGAPPLARLSADRYTPERSREVYAGLAARARRVLAAGHAVIVDAVSARPDERALLESVAAEAGVKFVGLWLEAPTDVLRARVSARRGDASDATPEVVDRQVLYRLGEMEWRRLDARLPIDRLAALAVQAIGGSDTPSD